MKKNANNKDDNKKKTLYVVAADYDGIVYYWHNKNRFHWNTWCGIIYYKSKKGAIRNAKKAMELYKGIANDVYVLQGEEGMALQYFKRLEEKSNN